jgi:hypothetical protein
MQAAVAVAPAVEVEEVPLSSELVTEESTPPAAVNVAPATAAAAAAANSDGKNATPSASASSSKLTEAIAAPAETAATAGESSNLAKTQPLQPAPPATARPSTSAAGSSSSSRARLSASASSTARVSVTAGGSRPKPSAAQMLPFYKQELVAPAPEVVQPLPLAHWNSLPAAALCAHISRANADALELMRQKQYQAALERLRRAEHFATHPTLRAQARSSSSGGTGRRALVQLRAATYNNLSILYKSVNNLRLALHYCNRALRLEINFVPSPGSEGEGRPNPAGTHLNMCAILSSMGRHSSALLHAECALSSLYMELHILAQQALAAKKEHRARKKAERAQHRAYNEQMVQQHGYQPDDQHRSTSSKGGASSPTGSDSQFAGGPMLSGNDKASLLHMIAISYFNMAVEYEFLRSYRASTHAFRRALEFAQRRLGKEHPMTRTIAQAYEGAANLHPMRVTAPNRSMDPLAQGVPQRVPKGQATHAGPLSALSTALARGTVDGSWSVPPALLESNPMVARHIPVRLVAFNSFAQVSGAMPGPGRGFGATAPASARSRRHHEQQQQYSSQQQQEEKEQYEGLDGHEAPEEEGDGQQGHGADEYENDDDFGPELTEHSLRARQVQQNRVLAQHQAAAGGSAGGSGSLYPSHPPPSVPMNDEDAQQHHPRADTATGTEEAGYWSDPEVSDLAPSLAGTPHGAVQRGGRGGLTRKEKHDPRTAATVSRGGGGRATTAGGGSGMGAIGRRASTGGSVVGLPRSSSSSGVLMLDAASASAGAGRTPKGPALPSNHASFVQQQFQQQQQQLQQQQALQQGTTPWTPGVVMPRPPTQPNPHAQQQQQQQLSQQAQLQAQYQQFQQQQALQQMQLQQQQAYLQQYGVYPPQPPQQSAPYTDAYYNSSFHNPYATPAFQQQAQQQQQLLQQQHQFVGQNFRQQPVYAAGGQQPQPAYGGGYGGYGYASR